MDVVNDKNCITGMLCYLSDSIMNENKYLKSREVYIYSKGPCYYEGFTIKKGQCVIHNKQTNEYVMVNIGFNNEFDLLINLKTDKKNGIKKQGIKISRRNYQIGQGNRRRSDSIQIRTSRIRC